MNIGKKKNYCFIAIYDSYLKALAPIANFLASRGESVKFYMESNISERVISHIQLNVPYEKLPMKKFHAGEYEQDSDVIFIGAGGRDFVKICNSVKPGITKIALFTGVNSDRIYQGFNDRSHADILLLNNSHDYDKYIKYAADFHVSHCRPILLGFSFLKKIKRKQGDDIVFFDQNFPSMTYSEKAYIFDKLMQTAIANPARKVVVKLRNRPGEKTPHKCRHNFAGIMKKVARKLPLPDNLVLSYGTMEEVLEAAEYAISVSSTAIIEAIYNDINSAILSDFGIRTDFGNELFAGSNIYASFDDIIAGSFPKINPEWANEYVVAAETNYQSLVDLIASVSVKNERAGSVKRKKNIVGEIGKKNTYAGYQLSKEIMYKKYKKFRHSPRIFFEDSNRVLVKRLLKSLN